jgi:hypothetical protein
VPGRQVSALSIKVTSISEVVAPIRVENDLCKVWASADADYDEAKSRLEVKLDSFLRRSSDNEHLSASWLPGKETVSDRVDVEEGNPAAKEIFENWVKRLRRAVLQKCFAVATPSTA